MNSTPNVFGDDWDAVHFPPGPEGPTVRTGSQTGERLWLIHDVDSEESG